MSSLIEAFQHLPLAQGLTWRTAFSLDWWLGYLKTAYDEDPYHFLVEFSLLFVVIWLIFRKSYDPKKTDQLTKQEEDELIAEWAPEPLCPPSASKIPEEPRLIAESITDARTVVNGKSMLNFVSNNFLGLVNTPEVKTAARQTVDKYGVGSCGPRGFYGSIDVHLKLEKDLASFYGLNEAIVYSDGIACASSVVPAFSKRGDLIVCDEAVHYGIQQGIKLSHANVLYFKHNDVKDLERVLQELAEKDAARPKNKLVRKFIVVEGVYAYSGCVVPLPQVVELKNRFKYRLLLDDSFGIGVLGKTGRGTPEHFNVPIEEIEILCGTIDNSLASVGGYCVGMPQVVDHQRLSGAGYCFSASAPPYTAAAASAALSVLLREPQRVEQLRKKAALFRSQLAKIGGITVPGDNASPVVHIRLRKSQGSRAADEAVLKKVCKQLLKKNIVVYVPEYIPTQPLKLPEPSIRVSVTILHSEDDLTQLSNALKEAFTDSGVPAN